MKRIVLGILAHVDSGKTTLSESMLYISGEIRKLGRVDHKNSFLDNDEMERNRGITIFSKQAIFNIGDTSITLLDTPGHVDFSAEMERALQVMDYAVLVLSASELIQSHTRTLWQLLKKYEVPTLIFVNKMDLSLKDTDKIIRELSVSLNATFVDFTLGRKGEDFEENIAVCDEGLLSHYLETQNLSTKQIARVFNERKLFPCYFGVALKNEGVEALIDGIDELTVEKKTSSEFSARVFKISTDNSGERLTHMKIISGSLKVKSVLGTEKVNQIRLYSGQKYTLLEEATYNMICSVSGLASSYVSQGFGLCEDSPKDMIEPVMNYTINILDGSDSFKVYEKLKQIFEQDPKLYLSYDDRLKEINVKLMGEMQLEILQKMVKDRFGFDIEFGIGKILYKETITNTVEGIGHFEPLRHYAEVHLLIEPAERGSGIHISSICSEDVLDRSWQSLIYSYLSQRVHCGVLTNSPLTDINITLVSGKAHKKHTGGADFREATYRALRQGLMQSDSLLLEPYYDFVLTAPSESFGRILSDMERMNCKISPPLTLGEEFTLEGRGSVSMLRQYQNDIMQATKGRGKISLVFSGYDNCPSEKIVVEETAYNPLSDTINPSDSVFCEGGSGFIVKWDEVHHYMHIESYLNKNLKGKSEQFSIEPKKVLSKELTSQTSLMDIFDMTYKKREKTVHTQPRTITAPKTELKYIAKTTNSSSKTQYILVDGYNLIFAWEKLKLLAEKDFGASREALIDILSNYQGYTEHIVILVFDAYNVRGGVGSIEKCKGIDVVYTKEAETADMYIEKTTHKIARDNIVRVVTSDALEQLIIMGNGALRVSSQGFIAEIDMINNEIKQYLT